MKVTRFSLNYLFNEEWAAYEKFLIKIIKQIEEEKTSISTLYPLLEVNATQADMALEIIRKSELTRLCDELDEKRDRLIRGIYYFVHSYIYDEETAQSDAANRLMIVLDHYRGMANENRDQESNRIDNFMQELRDNCSEQIKKIVDMERRLTQLQKANIQYIEMQDKRTFAEAEKTTLRMVDVRKEGDTLIRSLWDLTDILLLTTPTPAVKRFAEQLNVENQNIHTKLAARKGRKESDKTEQQQDN